MAPAHVLVPLVAAVVLVALRMATALVRVRLPAAVVVVVLPMAATRVAVGLVAAVHRHVAALGPAARVVALPDTFFLVIADRPRALAVVGDPLAARVAHVLAALAIVHDPP